MPPPRKGRPAEASSSRDGTPAHEHSPGAADPRPADWSRRHSVRRQAQRTVDLMNTLAALTDPQSPSADDVAAVAAVLREHGEQGELRLAAGDITAMTEAAQQLRTVFTAVGTDAAARAVDGLLARSAGRLRLTDHGGSTPWHPHLDGSDDGPWGDWFLSSSALALTVMVWDTQRAPGGVCASRGCEQVYLVQGNGVGRRYCSRRCATRERVAAHRARR